MRDHRLRGHAAHRGQRRHRHHPGLGLDAHAAQVAAGAAGAPGVPAFHDEGQFAAGRQHEAGLHPLALAPRQPQERQHLVEGQSERVEGAAVRLDPDLVHARPSRHPGLSDLRHRLQPGTDALGQYPELFAVRSRQLDLGRRSAQQPAQPCLSRTAAVGAAAHPLFAGAQDLEPLHRAGRLADHGAHARGPEPRGSLGRIRELHRERSAVFPDHRLHRVDAFQVQHRAFQAAHGPAGRFDRAPAGGEPGGELHRLGFRRLLRHRLHGDPRQRDDDRHEHRRRRAGNPGRGTAQGAGHDAAEEQPRPIRSDEAAAGGPAPARLAEPAQRGGRGQAVRQQRHQPQRDQQGCRERQQDRERRHLDQLAREDVVEVDETERQEDDRGGRAGRDDGPHRAPQALPHRGRGVGAALEPALHRLVHDHAVVHQQPDREGQPEDRDQVQRLAHQIQHRQRRQQAHRHRHRDHGHRPPAPQEEKQHRERDAEARGPQARETGDLVFHEIRGVEADHQVQAQRPQFLLKPGPPGPEPPSEPDQVGPFLLEDDHAHRGLPVDPEKRLPAPRAVTQVAYVTQPHGAFGGDADFPERVQSGGAAVEDDRHAAGFALQLAEEPQVADVAVHGFGDGLGGHAEGRDAIGVDRHRHLTPGPAARHRLADPGDGGEPRGHPLVHQVMQRVEVPAAGAEDMDHHREAGQQRGVEGRHCDRGPPRLRALQRGRDALQFELAHPEVGAGLEAHLKAARRAPNFAPALRHAGQGGHPCLQGQQDLAFDDLGFAAGPREVDEQAVAGQRGEQLDGHALPRHRSHQHDAQKEHRHRDRPANGEAQHVRRPPAPAARGGSAAASHRRGVAPDRFPPWSAMAGSPRRVIRAPGRFRALQGLSTFAALRRRPVAEALPHPTGAASRLTAFRLGRPWPALRGPSSVRPAGSACCRVSARSPPSAGGPWRKRCRIPPARRRA